MIYQLGCIQRPHSQPQAALHRQTHQTPKVWSLLYAFVMFGLWHGDGWVETSFGEMLRVLTINRSVHPNSICQTGVTQTSSSTVYHLPLKLTRSEGGCRGLELSTVGGPVEKQAKHLPQEPETCLPPPVGGIRGLPGFVCRGTRGGANGPLLCLLVLVATAKNEGTPKFT